MLRVLMLVLSFFLIAAKTVEVTDLGADATGVTGSTKAFTDAAWQAGPGGKVTCKPGKYRVANVLIFHERQVWDCPATILPAWNADSLFIVDRWKDLPKPTHLDLYFHTLDGDNRPDLVCMDVRNSFAGIFKIPKIIRCDRGLSLEAVEQGHGVWNNTFLGGAWTVNKEAIYLFCGQGCVSGSTIKVNFVAWNVLGLNMPAAELCSGTYTLYEGGFDFNDRDAIIDVGTGRYVWTYVTPAAPPTGEGLKESFYYIMGPDHLRTWHLPESMATNQSVGQTDVTTGVSDCALTEVPMGLSQ